MPSKPDKPVKKPANESRRTNVLLEELKSKFRTFGEDLTFVRKRVDSTFEEVGRHTERLDRIELRLMAIENRLTTLEVAS